MEEIKSTQQLSLSGALFRRRLEALRKRMKEEQIDAYMIVTDDFHASEYVGDYFKCREYISGFTGSAGTLLVTAEEAGLWTDGRYFLQAADQLKGTGIRLFKVGEKHVPLIPEYLKEILPDGACLGYDGRTVSGGTAKKLQKALAGKGIRFRGDLDLVGDIWEDRPAFPGEEIWLLPEDIAGKSRLDKLSDLRKAMKEKGADYHLNASLDDIAWLYNIRGGDIAYTPVAMAYTLVSQDRALLYLVDGAAPADLIARLRKDGVETASYGQIYQDLGQLPPDSAILYDENMINTALLASLPEGIRRSCGKSPLMLAKAIKNPVEMDQIRASHLKDGAAVTRLIFWLKKQMKKQSEVQNPERLTERDVCRKLEEFRRQGEGYLYQSFSPICAYGDHGAIIHYDPRNGKDTPLQAESFLLLDTGGQYLGGTTDLTRTISLGRLSKEQIRYYTAVLRGNLNLASAHFAHGCTGANLDALARGPIWELGLDYKHGTGHGVGYLLSVHEKPNGFRLKSVDDMGSAVFEEGMLTSDEPGVYLEGKYGIRIEDLMFCRKAEQTPFGQFMRFETVSLVPYDRDAIDPELMSERELARLNVYHARVYDALFPYLNQEEKEWLARETAPLSR